MKVKSRLLGRSTASTATALRFGASSASVPTGARKALPAVSLDQLGDRPPALSLTTLADGAQHLRLAPHGHKRHLPGVWPVEGIEGRFEWADNAVTGA
jgi:hypothetical protein